MQSVVLGIESRANKDQRSRVVRQRPLPHCQIIRKRIFFMQKLVLSFVALLAVAAASGCHNAKSPDAANAGGGVTKVVKSKSALMAVHAVPLLVVVKT